ncbi:YbjN domain-containing protein [Gleimia hominis]|uniref:YbjN domain-containing protein n=1 Tax=Gleimia hominis TaxID=595468 RepID=A0ABU3IC68_9ACTO|nr:YbjN domain-containing protein [Gleimia hominis]MDT3767526.1 YbjN domain-containing protein [Gleimia hominis]
MRNHQLFYPLDMNRLGQLLELCQIQIVAQQETAFDVVVDDMALNVGVSSDHVWMLIKSSFPVPSPGASFGGQPDDTLEDVEKALHLLTDATNEWNARCHYPNAYLARVGKQWVIRLDCAFYAEAGLTIEQFQLAFNTARSCIKQAMEELPELIPPA